MFTRVEWQITQWDNCVIVYGKWCPGSSEMASSEEQYLFNLYHWLQFTSAGWPQSRRKNSPSFPGFSTATNLLFHRLSQQKVNVIMTFVKSHDDPVYPVISCFTQIFEWRTKNTLFVTIFPWDCTEFTQFSENSEFSMFREIPEYSRFPGLWPPWSDYMSNVM